MKRIDKLVVAASFVVAFLAMLAVQFAISCWLAPYEQDTAVPIPSAVSAGIWDHPPVEGGVL